MMEPCWYCGVRHDVECKHRPASASLPPLTTKLDGRKTRSYAGNGYNFHRKKMA